MRLHLTPGVVLFSTIFITGCNSAVDNKTTIDTQKNQADTFVAAKDTIKAGSVNLKPVFLNEKTVFAGKKLTGSATLDEEQTKLFSVEDMDLSAPEDDCTYHFVDTLFSGSRYKIFLIGREYPEENIIWAAAYTANNDLIDYLQVYYDNSEGSLTVESSIAKNLITVKIFNDFAETDKKKQKTEVYALNDANKFVKQQ